MRALSILALILGITIAPRLAAAQDAGMPEAGVADANLPLDDAGLASDAGDAGTTTPPHHDSAPSAAPELPEELRPEITYTLTPEDGVMTGDLVHVTIVVRLRGEDDDVAIPRQDLGDLELHAQRHTDRRVDGHREFTFELDFLTLEPGEFEIAPITLRVVTGDGVIGTVTTDAHTVTVGSLIANEPDAQPRPATDPVVVMEDDYTLAYVLGFFAAMLLAALMGWLGARWWRRRPKAAPPPPPPRPAADVALEKLRALRKRMQKAVAEGKQAEIVDGASDVLREYLGARYDFNGLESTTDEVIARVRNARLGPISLNEIIALLSDADLVKFAKATPDEAQCDRMLEGAERIVRGTVPVATAVALPATPRIDETPARPRPSRAVSEASSTLDAPQRDAKTAPTTEPITKAVDAANTEPTALDAPSTEPGQLAPDTLPIDGPPIERPTEETPRISTPPSSTTPLSTTQENPTLIEETEAERAGKVDHLGRRIPDTNPPPPPVNPVPVTLPGTPKIKTLLGTADGPGPSAPTAPADATAPEADEPPSRPTPVGFSDPLQRGEGDEPKKEGES